MFNVNTIKTNHISTREIKVHSSYLLSRGYKHGILQQLSNFQLLGKSGVLDFMQFMALSYFSSYFIHIL